MIIQGLQAENLFKYNTISISGLEQKRRVLISGPNESGKTAIVESVCLGLFGRTVAHGEMQLAKAVKWGKEQASVTVTFLGQNNQSYVVYRYFDTLGRSQASLTLAGTEEPVAKGVEAVNALINGVVGFDFQHYIDTLCLSQTATSSAIRDQTIKSLAGVADLDALANELDDEILLDQEKIGAGTVQSQDLQVQLTVLNVQEEALAVLEKNRADSIARIATIETDRERWKQFAVAILEAAIPIESAALRLSQCTLEESTLDAWHGRARLLEEALHGLDEVCQKNQVEIETSPGEKLRAWVHDLQKRLSILTPVMESVAQNRYQMAVWLGDIPSKTGDATLQSETAKINTEINLFDQQRNHSRRWSAVALLLALLVGTVGGMLQFQAGSALGQILIALLRDYISGWDATVAIHYFVTAVVLLLLAVSGVKRSFRLRDQINAHLQQLDIIKTHAKNTRDMMQIIDGAANEPLVRQVEILMQLEQTEWGTELAKWAESSGSVLLKDKTQKRLLAKLQESLGSFRDNVSAYKMDIAEQLELLRKEQEQRTELIVLREQQIEEETTRRAQDQALRLRIANLEAERQQREHDIAVRRVAYDLLKGACKGLSTNFNQELQRFIAKSAPLFTQGRYQHLRIDDNLNVAAFSTNKNDFVDFNEISTGVRYQLLLAVHMALAQALIARTNSAPQFIVLDEPFVFFDRQRVRESLCALLQVSDQITQIWVIAQEYEQEETGNNTATDLFLRCTLDEDSLSVH